VNDKFERIPMEVVVAYFELHRLIMGEIRECYEKRGKRTGIWAKI
jgi:hypothetical protein